MPSLTLTQRKVLAVFDAHGPEMTLDALKQWSTSKSPRGSHGMTQAADALVRKGYLVKTTDGYRRKGVGDA